MTLLIALFSLLSWASNPLKLELVTEFHKMEASPEQLFMDGKLWSANSGRGAIEVFGDKVEQLASVKPSHFISRMVPMGSHQIVAYGKLQQPWRFLYTVVDTKTFRQVEHTVSGNYDLFPDRFVALPNGTIYASDIPERGIMKYRLGGSARRLNIDIGVPTFLVVVGNALYVTENHALGTDRSNLVRIDLTQETATRLFPKDKLPPQFSDLKLLSDGKTLVAAQVWNNSVVLIDTHTNAVTNTFQVAGGPRSVQELGRCLVVASEESKQVSFIDKTTGVAIAVWDLTSAGDRLKLPGIISVDAAHGRIYARSNYPCMTCAQTQASLWMAQEVDGDTFTQCQTTEK